MVQLGNQSIYETLPAFSVDLDKETVCGWEMLSETPEMLDKEIVSSGTVGLLLTDESETELLDKGITTLKPVSVAWAKMVPDAFGHSYIVIDKPMVTYAILGVLWVFRVISC